MAEELSPKYLVAVVGAGPAGLFAARQLAEAGAEVVIFNRDLKPGGLAEYGIYPDKHTMKEGLRAQFRKILALPRVHYYGNLVVGAQGDLSLDELCGLGFQAVLVTAGAQGTKWLGLPGEALSGVYHAKDLVYYYNHLPPYSQRPYALGQRVAIVGVGNVALDIARFLIDKQKVAEVVLVARRGPAETKYDKKELEHVVARLDLQAFAAEIERCTPLMRSLGQDPEQPWEVIRAAQAKAEAVDSPTHLSVRFLASPTRILGNTQGQVVGLEVEDTTLVLSPSGETKAKGLGTRQVLAVDTVVFAIGDKVDEGFGLPVAGNEFIKDASPRYPVEGASYETYDPAQGCRLEKYFVAGWSRQASTGLVGVARRDGTNGAKALWQYLAGQPPREAIDLGPLEARLAALGKPIVTQAELQRLEEAERREAAARGLEEFKYSSNEEMLNVITRETVE